jgi:FkbM family methyltransferase
LSELENESLARLIHIEQKIDILLKSDAARTADTWAGHPDQAFGHTTYAQHGEDLIIMNVFHRLGIEQPSFIDIGAHHPLNISNTALLYARGSRGINIEANPDLIGDFYRLRSEDINLNVGVGPVRGVLPFYRIDAQSGRNSFDLDTVEAFVAAYPAFKIRDSLEIQVLPLSEIIETHADGRYPNFLSIDVEGLDYAILESADFSQSRPDLICVEVVTAREQDGSDRMTNMLQSKGFIPFFGTIGNILFIAEEHRKAFQL